MATEKKKGLQALGAFLNKFIIIAVVAVVAGLATIITLSVFGHKARARCLGEKNGLATAVLIALIIMWLGGFIPYAGPVIAPLGMLATIILIFISYAQCKPKPLLVPLEPLPSLSVP